MRPLFALACCLLAAPALGDRGYRSGAVAAGHPAAAAAGVLMLEKGGNATDAAVATALVMAVVAPYRSGLGGGGFALSWNAKAKKATVLDFRELAPAGATREMFVRDGKVVSELATDGALSVAVPGAARGYLELLEQGGRLPRAVVLAPAIAAAKQGFTVTPLYQAAAEERADCLAKDPDAARLFLRDGKAPIPGTQLKQPELARTLEALAKNGARAFYEGPLAAAIAETVTRGGGVLTLPDLKAYRTRAREPLWGSYRGHAIATMPPPSAGGMIVLQTLGVLERAGPEGLAARQVKTLHVFIEAMRRAFVERAKHLGDPGFVEVPIARLTSPATLDAIAASIDPKKATPSLSLWKVAPPPEQKHTTHLSVVDGEGNAVALTTTINYLFGSCLVARGTGVLLNDEMDDFSAQPGVPNSYGLVGGEANAVAPGKVPLSSMSPTLVFQQGREEVLLAVGSPGGSTIPTTVAQVISHVVDAKLDVTRAVGFGRIHHQYLPDQVSVDAWGLEPETRRQLEALGHVFREVGGWGDAVAVRVDPVTGLRSAAADPRNDGAAAGRD